MAHTENPTHHSEIFKFRTSGWGAFIIQQTLQIPAWAIAFKHGDMQGKTVLLRPKGKLLRFPCDNRLPFSRIEKALQRQCLLRCRFLNCWTVILRFGGRLIWINENANGWQAEGMSGGAWMTARFIMSARRRALRPMSQDLRFYSDYYEDYLSAEQMKTALRLYFRWCEKNAARPQDFKQLTLRALAGNSHLVSHVTYHARIEGFSM